MKATRPVLRTIEEFEKIFNKWIDERCKSKESLFAAFIFHYEIPSSHFDKFIVNQELWMYINGNKEIFSKLINEIAIKHKLNVRMLWRDFVVEMIFK